MSNIKSILALIGSNSNLKIGHFNLDEHEAIRKAIEQGKLAEEGGILRLAPAKSNGQTSTKTSAAPTITMETLVSVRIGSDQYAATVTKLTDATVTVAYGRSRTAMTFRPSAGSWAHKEDFRLVVGESEERLDRSF